MIDVLLEELSKNTDWKSFDKENLQILKKFRISLMKHDVQTDKHRLSVQEILQMSRERTWKDARYREMCATQKRKKKPFKWNQKKKKKTSDQDEQSSSLSKETPKDSKNSCSLSKGTNHKRSNSRDSCSSVDSDYERDKRIHGTREFCLGDLPSNTNIFNKSDILKNPFEREGEGPSMSHKFSMAGDRYIKEGRVRSRCSSVSSIHSFDSDVGDSPVGCESSLLKSVSSQSNNSPTVLTKGLSSLSINSSEDEVSKDVHIGTRKMSLMSITSNESLSQSFESLSVQERVKQTYRTSLSYKKNPYGNTNLSRSDSTQSLNKGQAKQKRSAKNSNLQRSGSTQSLNHQQINPFTSKYLEGGFKSAFSSRDSVEEITRSMSFLPSFVRKNSESEAD